MIIKNKLLFFIVLISFNLSTIGFIPSIFAATQSQQNSNSQDVDAQAAENEPLIWTDGEIVERESGLNKSLFFKGSTITYENTFSAYSLDESAQISYNPYYAMSFSFRPVFALWRDLVLNLRLDLEVELTNADDTTYYHEPKFSDTFAAISYMPIYTIPYLGIDVGAAFNLVFPTGLESLAESRYLGFGPELLLSKKFDLLEGLTLSYSFRYLKYLNEYTTLQRDTNPYICPTSSGPECYAHGQLGDPSHSMLFRNDLSVKMDFFKWLSFTAEVLFYNYLNYDVTKDTITIDGDEIPIDSIDSPQNHVASIWYVVDVTFTPLDYLSFSIGTSTFSPQLNPDSTYRQPFFNRDTNFYVDVTLDLEKLTISLID